MRLSAVAIVTLHVFMSSTSQWIQPVVTCWVTTVQAIHCSPALSCCMCTVANQLQMQVATAVVIQFQMQIANDFHIQCMKERCTADALGDWIHVRASIEGSAPEVLRLFRSAYEGTQLQTISYQAADMWAVGMLLALMLTGEVPMLDPDVTGKSSSSISDEAERMASAATRLEQWVRNRVARQYFACMPLLLVDPSLSAVLEAWFLTRLVMSWY